MRMTILASLVLAATPVLAAPVPAKPVPEPSLVSVDMAGRAFRPDIIRLRAGTTYRLRFVNRDDTTHDFFAPRLLTGSRISADEGAKLQDGRLDVPAHGEASLVLTPLQPAPYDAKSTKAIDVVSGMTAQVLVY